MDKLAGAALGGNGRGVGNRKLLILVLAVLAERVLGVVERLFG